MTDVRSPSERMSPRCNDLEMTDGAEAAPTHASRHYSGGKSHRASRVAEHGGAPVYHGGTGVSIAERNVVKCS